MAGIVTYIFELIAVVVVGIILWKLAPSFSSIAVNQNKATKLVSYVYTPVFLIAILDIVPGLRDLSIRGGYCTACTYCTSASRSSSRLHRTR